MILRSVEQNEKVLNNVYTLEGESEAWFLTEDWLSEVLMQGLLAMLLPSRSIEQI